MNETVYFTAEDGEEYTFAQDGETMRKLFIVQCVFIVPLACCMVMGVMGSFMGFAMAHGADGHYQKA